MPLSVGIVGLPNVGKSTLFNALSSAKAEAANYPFCTIEPNVGVVVVPDPRIQALDSVVHSDKLVPTTINFVDIAGLVRGASKGEGLGNQFLAHIREVDAIVQVVRCFENSDIEHVMDTVDPIRDIEVVNTELVLADLDSIQKRRTRQQKLAKSGDKKAQAELALLDRLEPHLDEGKHAFTLEVTPEEAAIRKTLFLLTAKPTLFACNVAEDDLANPERNPWVQKVRDYVARHHGTRAVVVSAEIESELVTLPPDERDEYLEGLGIRKGPDNERATGTGTLIKEAYTLLGLRSYLTTGEKETRAWTIHAGDKAPQAAGVIHSDFEKGFISAETTAYEDLVACGSFVRARELGKTRTEGKDYVVQDGDVIEFKTFL